jgi:hypothetical protein
MKTPCLTKLAGLGVFAAMTATGSAEVPAMRDAATHEQIVLTLRKADQADPMKNMPVAKGEDPSMANRPKDLISQSDIISFQGIATLVPKRAILQIPKNYGNRIALEAGAQIMGWADFYARNRGWITTVEVSRTQAEGKLPLPDETQKQMTECGNLVVATYLGGPISVLPLKEPETSGAKNPEASGAKKPATADTQKIETTDTKKP